MNATILLVDDDELVRSGTREILETDGHVVVCAASGEEALTAARKGRFDLVLCDMVMPGIGGIATLRQLRQAYPHLPVIMITGHGSVKNALESLKSGATDYLQKPCTPQEILHRVQTVLDARELQRALAGERERQEIRKRDLSEQLARAERMASLGMMAAGVVEELRETLGPLKPSSASPSDDPPIPRAVLDDAVIKAHATLDDLWVIGRREPTPKKRLQLTSILHDFVASENGRRLRAICPNGALQLQVPADLPEIFGSEPDLLRAFGNLVTNAFESNPRGTVVVQVQCNSLDSAVGRYGAGAPGEYLVLSVADAGEPVRPEMFDRLFEPFYIRRMLNRKLLSGLGLTVVYRTAEDHGGFLDVTAGGQTGNVFRMFIPTASSLRQALAPERADFSGREVVLVVDDNREQRDHAAEMLQGLGYKVIAAANGREALALVAQEAEQGRRVDLAVLDLILGDDMDGVIVFEKLLEQGACKKAVILSGFADLARIVEARKLGVRQVVQKPFTFETLGRAVREELD